VYLIDCAIKKNKQLPNQDDKTGTDRS
jgi:hypothetical protein